MITKYLKDISYFGSSMAVTYRTGKVTDLNDGFSKVINSIIRLKEKGNKLIFIGNGGSASIANHMTTDLLKNAEIPAISFSDSSLLTCLSNDLGYKYVFQKPIEMFAQKGDILFSISSSGRSKNILSATMEAKRKGCFLVTLSGFDEGNPLRKMGDINFYIPSHLYGYVEIIHLAICHCIIDAIIKGDRNG